ncbi:MAG: methylated-DNA--[protein]-cysteine S-methyltransferase [Verrucomicrobiia bacterium]|jgi:methylated-DNA-[protein]-cysteine S-methyltransferase
MDHLVRDSLIVPTKLGPFRVQYSPRGISRVEFPSACSDGLRPPKTAAPPPLFIRKFSSRLRRYADGKPVRWSVPLDLSAGTAFQQAVWRALKTIPRGETRSYGWVAQKIGQPKASRAVGAACGANPVPVIVPCHRVIASDGSIGGFGGGLPLKRRLLQIEGVRF